MSELHFSLLELPVFLLGVGMYSALLKLFSHFFRPQIALSWRHAALCVLLFYGAKLFLFQISARLAQGLGWLNADFFWIGATLLNAALVPALGAWYLRLVASYQTQASTDEQSTSLAAAAPLSPALTTNSPAPASTSPPSTPSPRPSPIKSKDSAILSLLLYISMVLLGLMAHHFVHTHL